MKNFSWLFTAYSDERWYTTNPHHLTYTFLLKDDGRMYFLSLGVEGLNLDAVLEGIGVNQRVEL